MVAEVSYEIALRWMPLDLTDDKSTLVQVMAWCHQAPSHYLSQCWPRSMSPNDVTRLQWVKIYRELISPLIHRSLREKCDLSLMCNFQDCIRIYSEQFLRHCSQMSWWIPRHRINVNIGLGSGLGLSSNTISTWNNVEQQCDLVTPYGDKRSGSTLTQVMACCPTAPSDYPNQCWLIVSEVQRHNTCIRTISRCLNHQSLKSVSKLHV